MTLSFVRRCYDTEIKPMQLEEIFEAIKTGAHGLKEKSTQIRNRYETEFDITGDRKKAKEVVADLKLELPGWIATGLFSERANDKLIEYSGLLMIDVDDIGEEKARELKEIFKLSPFVRACGISPTGAGLKILFNVLNDPSRHYDSFRAIRDDLKNSFGIEVDEQCKDLARICFFSYDPDLWVRTDGNEIFPPADPLPRGKTITDVSPDINLAIRQQCAIEVAGAINWESASEGYVRPCPGHLTHTSKDGRKDLIVYLLPNDYSPGPTFYCVHKSCRSLIEEMNHELRSKIARAELFSHNRIPLSDLRNAKILPNGQQDAPNEIDKSYFVMASPMDMHEYVSPPEKQLIGDFHIVKDAGFVFVIGGPPGVGKSLSTISLGVAGAKGEGEWFGLKVHRKFKTMIIQTENGKFRLARIFSELDCPSLQDYLRVSEPPPYGLLFQRSDFRNLVAGEIAKFTPDIVLLDPWNSVARDQEQRTFLDTFDLIRSVLPTDDPPALGISAHTRKPQKEERASGRALMHIIAGSHVLASVPRTVFVIQPASDDPEDDQVIWTCCKNNDGDLGKRGAYTRRIGLFDPSPGFDWATFDASDKDKRITITEDMVKEVLEDGPMLLVLARDKLRELSGANQATCYRALSAKGRFAKQLLHCAKQVTWLK